jgi:tetratricopeptide (TPR) repeat protein
MQRVLFAQSAVPATAHDRLRLAESLLDAGNIEDARTALQQAASLAPDDAAIYRALAAGFQAAGLRNESIAAEMAALAFEQHSALMLYNLGTSYLMTQRPAPAEKWYRAALRIDPELVAAHQNLASILEVDGIDGHKAQAQYHRDQAYRRQSLFVDIAEAPKRTVLVLCAAGTGNVPFDFLLPRATTHRIKWVMDYASAEQADRLPPYDIVFNAIGDQDVTQRSHDVVERFLSRCEKPVLNVPGAIARTSRELIPELLKNIDQVLVPRAVRLQRSENGALDARELMACGIRPPLLVRPAGSHGGDRLQLLETTSALARLDLPDQDCYASAYHDYRSADGYYRKYRVIFVDRQPFPYHLAISEHWQVHYVTADMLPHRWKRDEERRFLNDPAAVMGAEAMQALRVIGQRLDLDFCGVDFSILADGRILIFEANATMLVHLEEFHAALQFKNPYVQQILDAFDAMLTNSMVDKVYTPGSDQKSDL